MTGEELRNVREGLKLTQVRAAQRWGMSQAYLSLVERGERPVPLKLVRRLARTERSLATSLPPEAGDSGLRDFPQALAALGYPPFAYLAGTRALTNPATLVLSVLRSTGVPTRVTQALPWVLATYPHLDWEWLVNHSKLANVQNRLAFLVVLATHVANTRGTDTRTLAQVAVDLEAARLANEDTLGQTLTDAERNYLRRHRTPEAAHWNLLTGLRADDLRYDG